MNADPLNLRKLPRLDAPPDLWPAIRDQLGRPRRPRWMVAGPAVAAMLVLAAVLGVLIDAPDSPDTPDEIQGSAVATAMAHSVDLEAELRQWQQRSVSAQTLHELVLLEVELTWLDLRLEQRPNDPALWRERGALLTEMIIRYAEPAQLAAWQPTHL